MTSSMSLYSGLGLVLVEYEYEYRGRDGEMVSIKPNERYILLAKTNDHWWQVHKAQSSKPFYVPAKYVKELPPDFPSPLDLTEASCSVPALLSAAASVPGSEPHSLEFCEELGGSHVKAGDEVTIRLRSKSSGRKTENRMSTFGVPLDFHDPLPLLAPTLQRSLGDTATSTLAPSELPKRTGRSGPHGKAAGSEDPTEPAKPRVPSFSPADPLPTARTHTLPIPVEMPVVPCLTAANNHQSSNSASVDHQYSESLIEPEKEGDEEEEGEGLGQQSSSEKKEEDRQRDEDYSHIYESIQDLDLDVDALVAAGLIPSTPAELDAAALPAQDVQPKDYVMVVSNSPSLPQVSASCQSATTPALSPASPIRSSLASPPGLVSPISHPNEWQVHTDHNSGRLFYHHRETGQSSWADPCSPPAQAQLGWEQLVDEASGKLYFYHASSGVTSWTTPAASCPSDSTSKRQSDCPPPLPEEDYPTDHSTHTQGHPLEKAGILNKTKVVDNGRRIRKNWAQSWTVLHGGILTFHKDPKLAPSGNAGKSSQIVPDYTIELKGASVYWAPKDKSSKKNVLELKTRDGSEYLMQYDTESIIRDWYQVIQKSIGQLEQEHLSEQEDDEASDREDKDRLRTSWSGAAELEHRRVRSKLRRFLQRRPTLQSVKEKGYIRDSVFGCHLDTLCHRENAAVPKFVEKCIRTVEKRGLDVDGIYRVSGNLAVIQKLRHRADHEEQLDLEDGQWEEIHVITGALKLFLRELPEPLFPFNSFDKFIAAIQLPDYCQRVSYMKDLVQTLPLPHHDTMELLFTHLCRVIEHGEVNRMSSQSVAIVFGPTLLRPETESANMTVHMVFQSQIVELMLKEFQSIFSQSSRDALDSGSSECF